ncbi:hypothetical protein CBM2623_U40018 [Cupriavidus taiwanensis]|nr:hypothetical protein CBM2608_A10098 [Cupriavidus taiwanensis]SPA38426.1 hypothetical protein CBM2623_U40018 [Cupriavidus taiwanensis]
MTKETWDLISVYAMTFKQSNEARSYIFLFGCGCSTESGPVLPEFFENIQCCKDVTKSYHSNISFRMSTRTNYRDS